MCVWLFLQHKVYFPSCFFAFFSRVNCKQFFCPSSSFLCVSKDFYFSLHLVNHCQAGRPQSKQTSTKLYVRITPKKKIISSSFGPVGENRGKVFPFLFLFLSTCVLRFFSLFSLLAYFSFFFLSPAVHSPKSCGWDFPLSSSSFPYFLQGGDF